MLKRYYQIDLKNPHGDCHGHDSLNEHQTTMNCPCQSRAAVAAPRFPVLSYISRAMPPRVSLRGSSRRTDEHQNKIGPASDISITK